MTREEEIADNGCSMQKCPINAFTFESCNLSKNECEYYTKSQEPCEDCISRQAAIDVMIKLEQDDIDRYGCKIPEGFDSSPVIEALDNLPSITPQPETGHWIHTLEDWNKWECSECGFTKRTDVHVDIGYKYCPNCGCCMESTEK